MQKKLVLMISDKMDLNKKSDRNEHSLLRMSAMTRDNLQFNKTFVELKPTSNAINSLKLNIFRAFSSDINKLKEKVASGELTLDEINRVGFVTRDTYKRILGNRRQKNIWISDNSDPTQQIENLVIGSDPEFLLFNEVGEVVRANSLMIKQGKLGCDGAMAELRPDPAKSPEEVVNNIMQILSDESLTTRIATTKWIAECYYKDSVRDYPVGGHIHIGNPQQVADIPMMYRCDFFNSINKIMDELLSVPMIKLDGLEKGSSRRTKCNTVLNGSNGYGWYGEWRECNGHFEHRTLSGLWLTHPTLAVAVLGTAEAIAKEVFKLGAASNYDMNYLFPQKFHAVSVWSSDFDSWAEIPLIVDMKCTTSSKQVKALLHDSDPSNITDSYLKEWYNNIKTLSTYSRYDKYIDVLYSILCHSDKELSDYSRDIKDNWLGGKEYLTTI